MIHSKEWKNNKKLGDFLIPNPITNQIHISMALNVNDRRKQKMTTLRESANEYVSSETKNIVDLKEVSTEMDLKTKVVNEGDENEFSYDYIVVDKEEYRVPKSVLKQLKAQLEEKPDSVKFKVTKTGEGMKTEYHVIMLD